MKHHILTSLIFISFLVACQPKKSNNDDRNKSAKEIFGNPKYQAFSFGTYRYATRDSVPSVKELKEDLKLTAALGVKVLRTYNTQHYDQAKNLLQAIKEMKQADANFEMYVMLGTWMQCEGAWTNHKNHKKGDLKKNKPEIDAAVALAKKYPTIVKSIAVGNESMIKWAEGYFVYPEVILKWVNYLQELKSKNEISKDLWITSSDNYEAWGGGNAVYRTKGLEDLIKAVDFISLHTYPYHATNYQPQFWGIPENEKHLSKIEKVDAAMTRAMNFAISQYDSTAKYVKSLGVNKSLHIGETGWSTVSDKIYGDTGTHASDEYKGKLFYDKMRDWTTKNNITCFYFKLMDESWKAKSISGSENNFGLIRMNGQAKFALWDEVDKGTFTGITRNGHPITKSFNGNKEALLKTVLLPPTLKEIGILETAFKNEKRKIGDLVTEDTYIVSHKELIPNAKNSTTYSSTKLHFMPIDGSCVYKLTDNNTVEVQTGTGKWWACALKPDAFSVGENLSDFKEGFLYFEIKGDTKSSFSIGYQTGDYLEKTLKSNTVEFGKNSQYKLTTNWRKYAIPIKELNKSNQLNDVTSLLSFNGISDFDGKKIELKNIYYSKK